MRYTPKLKADDSKKWHEWFAWHPIELKDGTIIWLETVERRAFQDPTMIMAPFGYTFINHWEYRVK